MLRELFGEVPEDKLAMVGIGGGSWGSPRALALAGAAPAQPPLGIIGDGGGDGGDPVPWARRCCAGCFPTCAASSPLWTRR